MIGYISDWQKRLRSRLYLQFRTKTTFQALADMLAIQAQDLEDAFQSLLTITSIDDSEGTQLRTIGRIIGQQNLGWTDAVYRTYLKVRVLVNRSRGTVEDLYAILLLGFGDKNWRVRIAGTKTILITSQDEVTADQVGAILLFLLSAKDAGARLILEYRTVPIASVFRFDTGPGYDVGVWADALDRV